MRDITKLYKAAPPRVFAQFMRCHPYPDLSRLMTDAVKDECYEAAAIIRDEIANREQGTPCAHDRFTHEDPQTDEQVHHA